MKHRSVSKVRSNKTSKKNRYVANQIANSVSNKKGFNYIVWCSKELVYTHNGVKLANPFIRFVNGTYCRAKHDHVNSNGEVTRYVGKNR